MSLTPFTHDAYPLPLCSPPFCCLHLWVCFRRFFFSCCQTLVMKSPVTGSDVECCSALGKRLCFSMTVSLEQKEFSSPVLTHRVESPRISQSWQKGNRKEEAFWWLFLCSWVFLSQASNFPLFPRSASWGKEADNEGLSMAHLLLPLQSRLLERHPFEMAPKGVIIWQQHVKKEIKANILPNNEWTV